MQDGVDVSDKDGTDVGGRVGTDVQSDISSDESRQRWPGKSPTLQRTCLQATRTSAS